MKKTKRLEDIQARFQHATAERRRTRKSPEHDALEAGAPGPCGVGALFPFTRTNRQTMRVIPML